MTAASTEQLRLVWTIPEMWRGESVAIIGGGPSLRGFDFTGLQNEGFKFIGCNSAYMLGDWVDVCTFGDVDWYVCNYHDEVPDENNLSAPGLKKYKGLVVTNDWTHMRNNTDPKLCLTHRHPNRFVPEDPTTLGFFQNTGFMSISLALKMGCRKILLLGFDMKAEGNQCNWHEHHIRLMNAKPNVEVWSNFLAHEKTLKNLLMRDYPDAWILNANPDSALSVFDKMTVEEAVEVLKNEKQPQCRIESNENFCV